MKVIPLSAPPRPSFSPFFRLSRPLSGAFLLLALSAPARADARGGGHTLVVASWGGALGKAQDQAFFQPFARATGVGVRRFAWDGDAPVPANRPARGRHAWAMALMEDSTARIACMQGSLQRLGGSAGSAEACSVPALHDGVVLAWDRGRIPSAPRWSDFWDVVRYPGKRGLRKDPRSTLEIALMADGVAPADVYTVLATPEGVARAFHKLSQLRPYIVWWTTGADSARIIGNGSVLMTSAAAGEVAAQDAASSAAGRGRRDVGLQWAQGLDDGLCWGIAPGLDAAERDRARDLLHYMAGTERVARFAALYRARPDDQAMQPLPMDAAFWQDHLPDLARKFADWLAAPA